MANGKEKAGLCSEGEDSHLLDNGGRSCQDGRDGFDCCSDTFCHDSCGSWSRSESSVDRDVDVAWREGCCGER